MLYKSFFLVEAAVANQSGAMEAETISKNGRSSKSHTSRGVFLGILCFALITMMSCGGDKTMTLTVEEVTLYVIKDVMPIKELKMIDERGKEIIFSNAGNWFEKTTAQTKNIPKGTSMILSGDKEGNANWSIGDDTKLLFTFTINGKTYPIGVGKGSKFVVQKTKEGKYNILPEETAKLSPPPIVEEE